MGFGKKFSFSTHQVASAAHHAGGVVTQATHHAGGVVSHATHHAGGVVAHTAQHAGGAVAHTAQHAGGAVAHTAKHVGGVVAHAAQHAGGVVASEFHRDVARKVVAEFEKVLGLRHLTENEYGIANSVFRSTVPLDRVLISHIEGATPFTVPGSYLCGSVAAMALLVPAAATVLAPAISVGLGALLLAMLLADLGNKYIIFFGQGYASGIHPFDAMKGEASYSTLIHELTHVWQGVNVSNDYVIKSIELHRSGAHFITKGNDSIYNPDPKLLDPRGIHHSPRPKYSQFNVEQQATIVEYWFSSTKINTKKTYLYQTYIEHNIRTKSGSA